MSIHKLQIETMVLGMVSTNCYLAMNRDTRELLVIDPADRASYIAQRIRGMGGIPCGILLTHGHFDHIGAARELADLFEIPVCALDREQELMADDYQNLSLPMGGKGYTVTADRWLKDGEKLSCAGFEISVIHTPGHTSGGACYYFPQEDVLFSGDTLFCNSVGRTDFPTGSMSQLHDSLHEKLLILPEETIVYPGHGEATSIEYEKRYNPY